LVAFPSTAIAVWCIERLVIVLPTVEGGVNRDLIVGAGEVTDDLLQVFEWGKKI
jgi:hypothetical protein